MSSPRSMFAAQVCGALMGCFLAPAAFYLVASTGLVGKPGGPYPNPFADIYRSMAVLGTEGFGSLPKHCTLMMGLTFLASAAMCLARDLLPRRYARMVPSPLSMSLPFYLGANNAINFALGSAVVAAWSYISPAGADAYATVAGSGLLVGAGVWAVPAAVLSMAGAAPPFCMSFSRLPPKTAPS